MCDQISINFNKLLKRYFIKFKIYKTFLNQFTTKLPLHYRTDEMYPQNRWKYIHRPFKESLYGNEDTSRLVKFGQNFLNAGLFFPWKSQNNYFTHSENCCKFVLVSGFCFSSYKQLSSLVFCSKLTTIHFCYILHLFLINNSWYKYSCIFFS